MVAASKQLERVGMNRVEGVPISSAVEVVANAMPRLNLALFYRRGTVFRSNINPFHA